MNTVTISRELTKNDDLVVLPRKEYEKLFRFWTNNTERLTKLQKQMLNKGFREIAQGKFFNSKQVKNELGL